MTRTLSIISALALMLLTAASDDTYVRVVLDAPSASPFRVIRYEVTKRAPATTAVHRRLLPGHEESLHALGLLTDDEAAAIEALLRQTKATALPDAAPARHRPGMLTWSVEVLLDGRRHRFRVTDPENLPDRRYQRLIDGVRRAVIGVTGPLPFRNVFFAPEQRGWVNVVSVPAAHLHIDGFDTRHDTPLYHYELEAGEHELRLVTADGRFDRRYQVKVKPQGTTNLRVDLR